MSNCYVVIYILLLNQELWKNEMNGVDWNWMINIYKLDESL